MKTKIIYISGGEVFPPHQVRTAFDTVRGMLGLDADTIIFGVPVDSDDIGAGAGLPAIEVAEAALEPIAEEVSKPDLSLVPPVSHSPSEGGGVKRERKRKKKETPQENIVSAPKEDSPSPILSIIGAVAPVEEETPAPVVEEENTSAPLATTDEDMLVEVEDEVRGLEDIFEGIPPLTEDKPVDLTATNGPEEAAEESASIEPEPQATGSDTDEDATLSKLAMEFIATKDNGDLPSEAQNAKGGKIGRLKNILPFKKKEKSESSVLGDLFGWAGVAANDDADHFAMPDFFQARH